MARQREGDDVKASGRLMLSARELPPPAGASDVLQAAVAARSPADRRRELVENVPRTAEEWLTVQSSLEKATAENLRALVDSLPVTVEHGMVGDVNVYHVTPDDIAEAHREHVFLHVHGGAHVLFGGGACYGEALVLALGAKLSLQQRWWYFR